MTEGTNSDDDHIYETEDETGAGGAEEGAVKVGGVSGEGVFLLEGDGGNKDNKGKKIEDTPEIDGVTSIKNGGGENDGENGEKVTWAEGTVKDNDFE